MIVIGITPRRINLINHRNQSRSYKVFQDDLASPDPAVDQEVDVVESDLVDGQAHLKSHLV